MNKAIAYLKQMDSTDIVINLFTLAVLFISALIVTTVLNALGANLNVFNVAGYAIGALIIRWIFFPSKGDSKE